jgi:hypothetical protein
MSQLVNNKQSRTDLGFFAANLFMCFAGKFLFKFFISERRSLMPAKKPLKRLTLLKVHT